LVRITIGGIQTAMQCRNCGSELSDSAKFCPTCGAGLHLDEAPVPEMQTTKQQSSTRRVALVLFPLLLVVGVVIFIRYINPSVHSVIKSQPVVTAPANYDSNFVTMTNIGFKDERGDLVFALQDLKQHRLVRFEYTGGQTPRAVMAYIAPTGQLVTAISVSEHCGSTEFKIKDNKIYCAHCPSYWDMMTMEAYACCAKYFPDPIPSRVAGDEVHVPKVFVEKWAGRL
jgi:uncharacterized Zn finger protein (UPF0148 family)